MTVREMWIGYQARLLDSWDHTANMLSAISGIMNKRPIHPVKLHPFRGSSTNEKIPVGKDNMEALVYAFLV